MTGANPIRGEVAATVGDLEIVLVADMNRLAALSRETGRPTFGELHARLAGGEVDSVLAAVRNFMVRARRDGKELNYGEAAAALGPQLDVAAVLRLGPKMTELLASLISVNPDKTENPLGNGTSAQN